MRTRLFAWTAWSAERVLTPVAVREMRSLMRGNRAPVILLICAALCVGIGLVIMYSTLQEGRDPGIYAQVGRNIFMALFLLELALATVLAPMLTAGSLAGEYERHTLDDLLLTRLSDRQILLGKLLAGMGFVAITQLCGLPVLAIAFILGGVSPGEVVCSQVLLLALAFQFSAGGLRCAVRCRKSAAAMFLGWVLALYYLVLGVSITAIALFLTSPDRLIKAVEGERWPVQVRNYVVGLLLLVLAPLIILTALLFLHPAVVISVLLLQSQLGGMLGPLGVVWWLLPLLSAGVMLYGGNAILNAAAPLRPRLRLDGFWPEDT